MSAPIVPCCDRAKPSGATLLTFRVSTYGETSRRVGEPRPMKPLTSPNCDAMPACERRYTGQLYRSLRRATSRMSMIPNVSADAGW